MRFACSSLLFLFFFFQFNAKALDTLSAKVVVDSIVVKGNKKTKEYIVLREFTFHVGDTISKNKFSELVRRSRSNLLNTSLFNFVTVDTLFTNDHVVVHLNLLERWYLFPIPVFEFAERNFNTWLDQPDLSRAIYGVYLQQDNFRGRRESFNLRFRTGYYDQFGISYAVPFIDKKRTTGISFSVNYSGLREIAYGTKNNYLRYFKAPNDYIRKEIAAGVSVVKRPGLYNTHQLYVDYYNGMVQDTITKLINEYYYRNASSMQYFTLGYTFKSDHRDFKPYALRGSYFDIGVAKIGLGILANEKMDAVFVASSVRKFIKLNDYFYVAGMAKARYVLGGDKFYFIQRAMGYSDYVRGYEYYVVEGEGYGLFKASIKYRLIKPRVLTVPLVPTEKFNKVPYAFYIELFSDAGYVSSTKYKMGNPLTNEWMFGSGVGLDFVTYYDIVVRADAALNRFGDMGVFLHIDAPF